MSLLSWITDVPTLKRLPLIWHRAALSSTDLNAASPDGAPLDRAAMVPLTSFDQHILVVEDESDIRRLLREVLQEEGYLVTEAVDGQHGLAVIRASTHPLIVLLDYKMPRMNGPELLQAVSADPHLAGRHAFIFVTANRPSFSPDLLQLVGAAAIPIIEKPFSIAALLAEIEQMSRRLRTAANNPTH